MKTENTVLYVLRLALTLFIIAAVVGAALAGRAFTVEDSAHAAPYTVTVDAAGNMTFAIKARQTIHITDLPAGTEIR